MEIVMKFIAESIGGLWRKSDNRARTRKVASVASGLGLEFMPDATLIHELQGCDLTLNAGQPGDCVNCFGGRFENCEFKVFEFRFVIGYGNSQQLHSQTVFYANPEPSLPEFQVKFKGLLNKFAGPPVNSFEIDDPIFAKEFWTSSVEPNRAKGLFSEEVKSLIRSRMLSVESNRGRLLMYRPGHTVSEITLKDFVTDNLQLLSQLNRVACCSSQPQEAVGV